MKLDKNILAILLLILGIVLLSGCINQEQPTTTLPKATTSTPTSLVTTLSDVYVDESGDTMTGDLVLGGDSGNSHYLKFYDQSNDWSQIYKVDGGGLIIQSPTFGGEIDLVPASETGGVVWSRDLLPALDNTWTLGNSTYRWGWLYTVNQTIGDLREEYTENPNYEYEVGDIVGIDSNSEYEIKPVNSLADRIIGVVSTPPHNITKRICENISDESTCVSVTKSVTGVSIYGRFPVVKVKGTIHVGDYLIASDEPGVVTSMYDKEHPLFEGQFGKSKIRDTYNLYAKMLPTLGIAMEDYDSQEVGTIKVVLGK